MSVLAEAKELLSFAAPDSQVRTVVFARELVQLAAELEKAKDVARDYLAAREREERLREALTFYAKVEHYASTWKARDCGCCTDEVPAPVSEDAGARARAALDKTP